MADLTQVFGKNGFDVNSVEPSQATGELIPTGWVTVGINKAKLEYTKNEQGQYIGIDFVLIGEFQNGRHLFENLNIVNANQKAMDIAYRDLSAIGLAINVPVFQNTDQFLGAQLMVRVVQKKNKKSGEMENQIGGYAVMGAHPEQVAKAPAPAVFQPTAAPAVQRPTFQAPAQQANAVAPPQQQMPPPAQQTQPVQGGHPWNRT